MKNRFSVLIAGEWPDISEISSIIPLYMIEYIYLFSALRIHSLYQDYEMQLHKGDTLFLYTDGVPEATNASKEMFKTEGLIEALNEEPDAKPQKILENVKHAVDTFAGDAPQFDDLTMLAIRMLK